MCHVYVRRDGISGIVVADQEYPPRVAFALLNKLIDEYDKEQRCVMASTLLVGARLCLLEFLPPFFSRLFVSCNCSGAWKTQTGPAQDWAPLTTAVADYQDPSKADKISAIQKELDDTTAVLVRLLCTHMYNEWTARVTTDFDMA